MTDKMKPAKLIVWDIDNVLYPYDGAFWNMICEATAVAVMKVASETPGARRYTFDEAKAFAVESRAKCGNASEVFTKEHGLDKTRVSAEFLAALKYDFIKPNRQMIEFARRSGAMHAALTHNSAERGHRIIQRCGLGGHIPPERIISVTDLKLALKDKGPEAFEHIMKLTGVDAPDAIMVENSPDNLRYPRQMGMQTVLIERAQPGDPVHAQHKFSDPLAFLKRYTADIGAVRRR